MSRPEKLAALLATSIVLAACSTTDNAWRSNYGSSKPSDTPAWNLTMPGTTSQSAAPITRTPDKEEGDAAPAVKGPTGG
jgi:hypothetical protein